MTPPSEGSADAGHRLGRRRPHNCGLVDPDAIDDPVDPVATKPRRRVGARAHAELVEDVVRVVLHRREGDEELSGGTTKLGDAEKDDFRYLSREWGAVYQRLAGPATEQLVIIGSSTPQFLFAPHK